MKYLILCIALSMALTGCTQKKPSVAAATKPTKSMISAGKIVAERECQNCHGMDGEGRAPGIPDLAAQRAPYLLASINEYKDERRIHGGRRGMMASLNDTDAKNVVAYYSSLPPLPLGKAQNIRETSPYLEGKTLAAACSKCHGVDGNAETPGIPSLAGQQPRYLVDAIQEYHQGQRNEAPMKSMLSKTNDYEFEKLALYFAAQKPVERPAPSFGNAAAGEADTAMCGGCHGPRGVSNDAATPNLAGQDATYLVKAIKSYRNERKNWGMQRYVSALDDKQIDDIAAYYASQKPKAADLMPASIKVMVAKCNRSHAISDNPAMVAPKLNGQDRTYLMMALRAYRDGRRQSFAMHSMSYAYSNAIIEGIASWYASQPAD